MTKKEICVILGTAHGYNVKGKQSPDGTLKEYQWSRKACAFIQQKLQEEGYRVIIDHTGNDEIGLSNRAQIVNNYCAYFGASKCLYFSIHNNAAGSDGKWKTASGWESHIAKNASEKSKRIANILWEEFEKTGLKLRRPLPKQNYWTSNFTVLTKTKCPAVLVETLFQDNKEDVKYLLSNEGFTTICNTYICAIKRYVDEFCGETQQNENQ